MPRTAAVTVEEVVHSLKKFITHFASSTLPPYSSRVWEEISEDLKRKWTAHHVYNSVVQNRRNILTLARSEKRIIIPNECPSPKFEDSTLNKSTTSVGLAESHEDNENDKSLFIIQVTSEEWNVIKPKRFEASRKMKKFNVSPAPHKEKMAAVRNLSQKITPVAKVAPAQQKETPVQINRACAVLGCDEYKLMPNHLFFRFPEEASLRAVWTEMTGRVGWTPNDYSYICVSHFTPDCMRRVDGRTALDAGSVPTLKLPHNVMEVEYVDEDILDKEIIMESEAEAAPAEPPVSEEKAENQKTESTARLELLTLFTEVQSKQNRVVAISKRIRHDKQMLSLRERNIKKLKEKIRMKEKQLQEKKQRSRPKSPDESLDKDSILVMPTRYTEEAKSLALNIYSYSPESYIYMRNTLRTLLPSTELLDSWVQKGYKPKNVLQGMDCVKIVTEAKETELLCKVAIV